MPIRNPHFQRLATSYLFPQIQKRVRAFLEEKPDAKLIHLGIGDTTGPLSPVICQGLNTRAQELGTIRGYRGYGPEQGDWHLRTKIAEVFYQNRVTPDEVFISDGAKCDLARLLFLFGANRKVAVQNPTYPAFVDAALLSGHTLVDLPCTPENDFFPALENASDFDLLYFCSPNNPTGAAATYEQLEKLVDYAQKRGALLLYDAAYAGFIEGSSHPRSIFDIPHAKEVAIEISSFSKWAGFTGVRLSWTVVPHLLRYQEGEQIHADWNRIMTTLFNGASTISQAGGEHALTPEGQKEMHSQIDFYKENAALLRSALQNAGYTVYGGVHAPYLWIKTEQKSSWELFQELLEQKHLVTTPGVGFGAQGEGFLRLTAFGHRDAILEAMERLQ